MENRRKLLFIERRLGPNAYYRMDSIEVLKSQATLVKQVIAVTSSNTSNYFTTLKCIRSD